MTVVITCTAVWITFFLLENTENVPTNGMDERTTQIWKSENEWPGGQNAQ